MGSVFTLFTLVIPSAQNYFNKVINYYDVFPLGPVFIYILTYIDMMI